MSSQRLKGQTAWISGGASGMGEATAELFAQEGANVAVVDIQAERGTKLVERIKAKGGKAIFTECDVAKEAAIKGSIDPHGQGVRRAAISWSTAPASSTSSCSTSNTEAEWDQLMGVNVKSIFFSIKHGVVPHLLKHKRSYVTTIGSIGSFISQAKTPAYITSKGAVLLLSKSIALDYAADGLRLQLHLPRHHRHAAAAVHLGKNSDAELAKRIRRVPTGVPIQPARHRPRRPLFFL